MPYGMYISAAGADAQSQRLQVLSNNLANVDTLGFKREVAVLQARHAEAIERGELAPSTGAIEDLGGGVHFAETLTDFRAGAYRRTGNKTDMAINGEGFFLVERDGQQLLTRAGNFRFSGEGELQTDKGYPVISENGEPIVIELGQPWDVSGGTVLQGGEPQTVALVKPQSLGDLAKAGENLFAPLAAVVRVTDRQIENETLEQSGVNSTAEMMKLIETSRAYEANVKMIQNHDHMIGALVNRVLRQ